MASRSRRDWRLAAGRVLVMFALSAPALAASVQGPLEDVVFEAGDTIRSVAERYLKDADLWPQILELSGVASPADLKPGVALKVPVQQVATADEALAFSLAAIQKATAEGARIFAPVEIGQAIENRDIAVEQRDIGAWAEVVSYAGTATEFADRALAISVAQRDRAAEAVVSDAQGSVEGRTPDQPRWSRRATQDILVEFERLRTLSSSTAQVTFRDLSRLRLNPNSNAIIQRMRSDPLTGGEVTKVSLVNGDFYALLNQLGDRTNFEVAVHGLETATQSADFWVKHDDEGSRFTNYDAATLEITRGIEKISIGENEGAVVPDAGTARRARVLARTQLAGPFDGAEIFDASVTLSWQPAEGAEGYWLEVAADPDFNVMQASEWGVRDTSRSLEGLEPGDHYWRVSSLDRLGLPGVRSLNWRFRMMDDQTPPYVTLGTPREAEVVTTAEVAVAGEAEPGAQVTLNSMYVPVADNGDFATTVTPVEGENNIRIAAVDRAGNRTERTRTFTYRPVEAVSIALDPAVPRDAEGRLLSASSELAVAGLSSAGEGSGLRVLAADGSLAVQTRVDAGGAFHFTVPAPETGAGYRVDILGADQTVAGTIELVARQDAIAPELLLHVPPPKATADAWLDLAGAADGAVTVTVNGSAAPLSGDRFEATATLTPGANGIEIVATDAVGNVAIKRVETIYDIEPPEVLSAEASRPAGAAGPIEIIVEARDASGLRQAAPFVVRVGGTERRGFLRCDSVTGVCRETLPPEPGALALIEVTVEDYAGNAAKRQE